VGLQKKSPELHRMDKIKAVEHCKRVALD